MSNIKEQIISALSHPEAEEGLYLDNLHHLHEEDQRTPVEGTQLEILDALKELMTEGKVKADDSGSEIIFTLA